MPIRDDLRFALRMVRRSPGFAAAAVLTLALAIGAATEVFSLVRGVLLEPLPFADPSRLVAVMDTRVGHGGWEYTSLARFDEWRRRSTTFDGLAALHGCSYNLMDAGVARRLLGRCVTPTFFPMLGVKPLIGAPFPPDAERPGNHRVLLLGYEFWQREFGGDPHVVGRTLPRPAGDTVYKILGVLPPGLAFGGVVPEIWAPLPDDRVSPYRELHETLVFARLKHGVSLGAANAELGAISARLAADAGRARTGAGEGDNREWRSVVIPLRRFYTDRNNTRATLLLLFGAVGVLLLIACANIANLLLARSMGRRTELALRLAIGASTARVLQQLVTESAVLGCAGGAAGFALTLALHRVVPRLAPALPTFRADAVRVDTTILIFAIAVGILSSVAFAVAGRPRALHSRLSDMLRDGSQRTGGGYGQARRFGAMVAVETGLAVVLLAGAGLLATSFRQLGADDLGVDTRNILTFAVCCLDRARYPTQDAIAAFYRNAAERLAALPGVETVGDMDGNTALPLAQQATTPPAAVEVRGRDDASPAQARRADLVFAGAGFFSAVRLPATRGRVFDASDGPRSAPVAVVNEALARELAPDANAIGQLIRPRSGDGSAAWYAIVGVVRNAKQRGRGSAALPTVYLTTAQTPVRYAFFLVRTRSDPLALDASVRAVIHGMDPNVTTQGVRTLDVALGTPLASNRFAMWLVASFAVVAVMLAAVGVFGVTAYTVSRRKPEIALRLALGARTADISRMIVSEELTFGAIGVAAGVPLAILLARLARSLLFGIGFADLRILFMASASLLAIIVVAAYLPARRAARLDPSASLRSG